MAKDDDKIISRNQPNPDKVPTNTVFDFKPLHDFVHLTQHKMSEIKTAGGILMPGNVHEKAAVFKVEAVGPGYFDPIAGKHVPVSVEPGDYILLDVPRMMNVSYGGQECLVCKDADIIGKVIFKKDPNAPAA